jgi:hypothetical protein
VLQQTDPLAVALFGLRRQASRDPCSALVGDLCERAQPVPRASQSGRDDARLLCSGVQLLSLLTGALEPSADRRQFLSQQTRVVRLGLGIGDRLLGGQPVDLGGRKRLSQLLLFGNELGEHRRRRRLSFEWSDSAAQLDKNVVETKKVVVDPFDLAYGAVLALAELPDLSGFFDEVPALLGPRVEDRVQLSLTDDGVDASTDARVRQQLRDVEQPARGSVDLVFGGPGPVRRPRDRHLTEIERQHP